MNHGIDRHADLGSAVHRWDPRLKLVGLGCLILACAFVTDPRLLPLAVGIGVALAVLARLPLGFVAGRLRYPGLLILVPVTLLPFVSGETVLARWGPLAVHVEGVHDSLLIAGRFTAIVVIALVAFATAPMATHISALRALRLPDVLADMVLLTYRYLFELGDDLRRMRTATGLRGFRPRRPDAHTLTTVGSLAGSMLIRGHDRSVRVHRAMVLRGYGAAAGHRHGFRAGPRDVVALGAALALSAGLVLLEVL